MEDGGRPYASLMVGCGEVTVVPSGAFILINVGN